MPLSMTYLAKFKKLLSVRPGLFAAGGCFCVISGGVLLAQTTQPTQSEQSIQPEQSQQSEQSIHSVQSNQPEQPDESAPVQHHTSAVVVASPRISPQQHARLQELSQQAQQVYAQLQQGTVRVQVPVPLWLQEIADRDNPLHKWRNQLDPAMRHQLEVDEPSATQSPRVVTVMPARSDPSTTTAPSTSDHTGVDHAPGAGGQAVDNTDAATRSSQLLLPDGRTILLDDQDGKVSFGSPDDLRELASASGDARPRQPVLNEVGLLLDEQGHFIIPLYIEPSAFDGRDVTAWVDHTVVTARFVASDQLTNLTILKLNQKIGTPLVIKAGRPHSGSLVIILNPNSPQPQLHIWAGGLTTVGLVAAIDGSATGFIRYGLFTDPIVCHTVIEQLLTTGHVDRAFLGLVVRPLVPGDPVIPQLVQMQMPGALRVQQVLDQSAAQKAGVRPGDYLLNLAGKPTPDSISLGALLAQERGERPLVVLRDGQTITLQVILDEPATAP